MTILLILKTVDKYYLIAYLSLNPMKTGGWKSYNGWKVLDLEKL